MEAGLDNANATNNLFTNSNGAEILQHKEGFLLNLTEGFKQKGDELSPPDNYMFDRPTNGKRPAEEFDEDEDMGPETDVDAIDDGLSSPISEQQILDNKNLTTFDPFTTDIEEKGSIEMDLNTQKQRSSEFEVSGSPPRSPREETATPPANEAHDAGVEENVADSGEDSEDEWNYYKGDSGDSTKVSSSKADQEVAELTKTVEEEDEAMSQLNPNAAEFVPTSSPTRSVVSPACRALLNDQVIAQSPRKATPTDIDINLPNPQDFEKEVKSRPSDVFSNSQDSENSQKLSSQEVMENLLNGKNIEDIEFRPASTPVKTSNTEEFHFGPNATPFSTPAKFVDQSEAALSTKAEFGDESSASYLEGKTLAFESAEEITNPFNSEDVQDFQSQLNKPTDPMSMSFYQDQNEVNPFDLNKVQMLPDDDEFTEKQKSDSLGNITSDLLSFVLEHDPLGCNQPVTDLDKPGGAHETQLLTEESNSLYGVSKLPESPKPSINQEIDRNDDNICNMPTAKSPILIEASKAPLPITPEPNSEEQDISSCLKTPDAVSPIPQEHEMIEKISSPILSKSPLLQPENNFDLCDIKSSGTSECNLPKAKEESEQIKDLTKSSKSSLPTNEQPIEDNLKLIASESAVEIPESVEITDDLLCQPKSPEPVCVNKFPVPTPEPVTETHDEFQEFFTIDQKTNITEVTTVEENKEKTKYLPECSQSPISEVPPLMTEKEELTEIDNVNEISKSPIKTIQNDPELIKIDTSNTLELTLNELGELENVSASNVASDFYINAPKDDIYTISSNEPEMLPTEEVANLLQKSPEIDFYQGNETEDKIPESNDDSSKVQLCSLELSEQLLVDEIQNILDKSEPSLPITTTVECEAKSPETIEESLDSEKRDLDSPMEDITSSVKDDNSLTPEIIEEAKDISTEKGLQYTTVPISAPELETLNRDYKQELFNAIQETTESVANKEVIGQISSTPNTTMSIDTESVNTADVNSFLNRSNVLDVTSPLSPTEQTFEEIDETQLLPTEDIIKTDLITPQYPEEAVITPSEETKMEIPVTVDDALAPAALPEVVPEAEVKQEIPDENSVAPIATAATIVAATAMVAATSTAVKDKKASSKPLGKVQQTAKKTSKPTPTTTKMSSVRSSVSKIGTSTKSTASSPTKQVPPISKASKPPSTIKPPSTKTTPIKPSPKSKIDITVTKSAEKKNLANGDVKAPPKTSPAVKKLSSTTTRTTSAPTKMSTTSKLNPAKTDTKSSVVKTSTVSARLTSATTAKSTNTSKTTTANTSDSSKLRPTSLVSKISGSSGTTTISTALTASAPKTTVQPKTSTSTISPRTTTAKSKPPTSLTAKPTNVVPKPRLLLSKTSAKGPDTEKQLKDSVNKQLTANRSTTISRTSGTLSAGKTSSVTTIKKTDVKSPSTRTTATTKTTITTLKSTSKKPAEITRINKKATPTKTTIKSQENGLTNGVTTIVQETTTILSTEPQLIKDLSPVENKLIVDNSQLSETNIAD